jgi:hypothetical protein
VFARGNRRRQVARPARGPALRAHRPWYVARALRAEVARLARRRGALLGGAALLLAGCGALPAQDENEPEGKFPVDVVRADFPEQQKLAKDSQLVIEVKNEGKKEIPDVNVTVHGFSRKLKDPTDPDKIDPTVANPSRPVFVVDKSPIEFLRDPGKGEQSLVDREVNPPEGSDTAFVNTYSLGELGPGATAVFRWDVSAVEPGPFRIRYEVNAGLDGLALAVDEDGEQPTGSFSGEISDTSPAATVADDGETIVTADGRRIRNQRGVELKDGGSKKKGKKSGGA